MRYQGQIRFPDVVTGDLDVSVEVDDTHVRILSGGKSLGRWCLADVVADRLLANEFELDLDGEVVRFLAEDQINFAYGAVQAMAEGWARYQAMNFVKRSLAVASARKANEPSRLRAAHEAFVMAREALGDEEANVVDATAVGNAVVSQEDGAAQGGAQQSVSREDTPEERAAEERQGRFRRRHLAPADTHEAAVDSDQPENEPEQTETEAPGVVAEPPSKPLVPVDQDEAQASPPPIVMPDAEPASPQPTLSERLAQARVAAEAASHAAAEQRASDPTVLSRKVPRIDAFPGRGSTGPVKPTGTTQSRPADQPATGPQVDRKGGSGPLPVPTEPQSKPKLGPGTEQEREARPEVEIEIETTEPEPTRPSSSGENLKPMLESGPSAFEPGTADSAVAEEHGRLVESSNPVGTYADGHHPSETSGLRASLRSVFSRSTAEPHEHSYVASTTAVGLTRKVCIECGHVSIGVSD